MKEKIKNIIFYGLTIYCVTIVILTILNITNMQKTIELTDSTENIGKINELKKEINKLEENSCKNILNDMIKTYEQTSYNGTVEYKEIYEVYWNGKTFLSFYEDIIKECNLTEEKMQSMNMEFLVLNSTAFVDHLVNKKMLEYELGIKDKLMRETVEANRNGIDYKLSKKSEIIMIESILKTVGGLTNE